MLVCLPRHIIDGYEVTMQKPSDADYVCAVAYCVSMRGQAKVVPVVAQ